MLLKLIEQRDKALEKYSMDDSTKNLGLYNRAVSQLKNYISDNIVEFTDAIDTLAMESENISHEDSGLLKEKLDLTDINEYNTDFEVD